MKKPDKDREKTIDLSHQTTRRSGGGRVSRKTARKAAKKAAGKAAKKARKGR